MEVRDAPNRRRLSWIRRPVRREGAERYLLVTLVSFAATVIVTRWFLTLTGFPRIGGGDLHIAHALWGGAALATAGYFVPGPAAHGAWRAGRRSQPCRKEMNR